MRKPGRTAVTAAALMIGLALVVFVTVFASGFKGSISRAIDRNFQGDLVIQNMDGFSQIPATARRRGARVAGVSTVSSIAYGGRAEDRQRGRAVSRRGSATVNRGPVARLGEGRPGHARAARAGRRRGRRRLGKGKDVEVGDRCGSSLRSTSAPTFTVRGTVKDKPT